MRACQLHTRQHLQWPAPARTLPPVAHGPGLTSSQVIRSGRLINDWMYACSNCSVCFVACSCGPSPPPPPPVGNLHHVVAAQRALPLQPRCGGAAAAQWPRLGTLKDKREGPGQHGPGAARMGTTQGAGGASMRLPLGLVRAPPHGSRLSRAQLPFPPRQLEHIPAARVRGPADSQSKLNPTKLSWPRWPRGGGNGDPR